MPGFFKPTPVTEALTLRLKEALAKDEVFISYEDLCAVADMDVQEKPGYGYLLSARRRTQEEDQAVWECERGKGLYLMETTERCGVGKRTAKKVRGQVKRGKDVLETVKAEELRDPRVIDKYNVSATTLLVMENAAAGKTIKKIESTISEIQGVGKLPLNEALELMRDANRRQTRD